VVGVAIFGAMIADSDTKAVRSGQSVGLATLCRDIRLLGQPYDRFLRGKIFPGIPASFSRLISASFLYVTGRHPWPAMDGNVRNERLGGSIDRR
jgi:hypothetical protein